MFFPQTRNSRYLRHHSLPAGQNLSRDAAPDKDPSTQRLMAPAKATISSMERLGASLIKVSEGGRAECTRCQGGTASQLCWCGTWAQKSPSVTPQVFETTTTEFSKLVCNPCILLGMKVGDFSHPVIQTIYILTSKKGTALH